MLRPRPNDTNHFKPFTEAPAPASEESLVNDARAGLTPAQMVDQKLVALLESTPLPVGRPPPGSPRRPVA